MSNAANRDAPPGTCARNHGSRGLAQDRLRSGESYLAGGATLNELVGAPRLSRDLDVFHDTEEALTVSWQTDRASLEHAGYLVSVFRERPGFVEADIRRDDESVLMQWARDSAYRFFPLVQHPDFGLTLHPFDLATSKVLALVGRVEPRDFVDTLTCDRHVQPLGYLAWAACGKDPGFRSVEHPGGSGTRQPIRRRGTPRTGLRG